MLVADLVRYGIIVSGALLGAAILTVMSLHWKAYRALRCQSKSAGLLPLHVAAISASYGLLVFGWTFTVMENIGKEVVWFHWMTIIAFLLGLVALFIVAKTQRRRVTITKPTVTVHIEEEHSTKEADG